jgi:2'-5' RNA ligase
LLIKQPSKYGDLKRSKVLQRGRREKSKMERNRLTSPRRRKATLSRVRSFPSRCAAKSYKTAIVAIPPDDLWKPIQGMRKQHDRHYRRWMPHITLLYPFRPVVAFEQVTPLLNQVCSSLEPFEVQLARFDFFTHTRRNATLYLIPEPAGAIRALQKALLEIVPDCGDVNRFRGGFTPHLSVGQAPVQRARALCAAWQDTWKPLAFNLLRVYLIWRNEPPDDIFHIGPVLSLGQ